jgi:hypothetical protein
MEHQIYLAATNACNNNVTLLFSAENIEFNKFEYG